MSNFANYSNFNKDAAYTTVKFGAESLVTEVDLNESQNILTHKLNSFINDRFGNGFYKTGTLTFNNATVIFQNDKALVNGNIITISSLSQAMQNGDIAYLDVWEEEVNFSSTIKKYGNQQEVSVTNTIKDSRITEETTRRYQLKYNITKNNAGTTGHTYLQICRLESNTIVDTRESIKIIGSGSLLELEIGYTSRREDKDLNGKFLKVLTYRQDNSLYKKSVLTGDSPNYSTRTETIYSADGVTSVNVKSYTQQYDLDGDWIGEVLA